MAASDESLPLRSEVGMGTPERPYHLPRPRGKRRPLLALLAGGLAVAGIASVSAIGRKRSRSASSTFEAAGLAQMENASPERDESAEGGATEKKRAGTDSIQSVDEDAGPSAPARNISYRAYNPYTVNASLNPYRFLPWDAIAEPYRTTTLEAVRTDTTPSSAEPGSEAYQWSVDGEVLAGWTGPMAEYTFTTTGFHSIELKLLDGDGAVMAHVADLLMAKYVRREIRALTDDDRTSVLDAMKTVYTTPTGEGAQMYGDGYKGIEYFVRKHLYGAASRECDHWHDDAGIMTHHVGFTLEFERNLQLVDPSVSMPYWEYTQDDADYCVQSGSTTCWQKSIATSSPIFSDDWFGEAVPTASDHSIGSGRWEGLAVMQTASNYSAVTNSYGLLRSPWNTDPTPKVMRHDKVNGGYWEPMVGCSRWDACFESETLADMNNCLNGGTHGPIHIMTGGQWSMNYSIVTDPMSPFSGISGPHLLLAKHLWRYGYLNCPETCSSDTPAEMCTCQCGAESREGTTPYEILAEKTPLMHWLASHTHGTIAYNATAGRYTIVGYSAEKEEKTWNQLLTALCEPGHVGEMYTSAAPYDPLFWVLHPTAERLLQWRRLLSAKGWKPFNETWGYAHHDDTSDLGRVCNWAPGAKLATCEVGTCPGHNTDDVLPFESLIVDGEMPTNAELYEFIHPMNTDLPYVYDNYDYSHCARADLAIGWDVVPRSYL